MIEYIHPEQLPKIELEIARPNRTVIGRIKEVKGITQRIKLGQINEISFSVPYQVERNYVLIDNPIIPKLKSQYHIKATFGEQVEWYVVANLNSSVDEKGVSYLDVQLKSLGYQLKNKKIRTWAGVYINGEYTKESLNAQQVLNELLSSSAWSVDYIDSEFIIKYRSFDFQGTNVLDAIYNVAETFGAIIKWDTINKSISLIKQENAGINKGFRISERKYLKSLNKEEKSDEIVTRLRVYGKDGISINSVNPTGTDYLEDYSYFMQGFERDSDKTTISSSEYMSDSLCHALLDYQEVIESNQGEFSSLLSQKETILSSLNTKQNELFDLDTQLQTVLDSIDVKQTTGLDYSAELIQKSSLLSQIATKESEITTIDSQIDDVDFQIIALKNLLDIENNLTAEQIIELDDYVFEETWEDQNYTDVEELYNDAKKVFDDLKKPKEIITTNIINFFKLLEGKQDWKKVNIGDKFFINYERFGIDVETQLIELEIDHEGNGINVTIANTKDIERDEDKLAKLLYGSISTSNTVNMGKYKWDQINNVQSDVNDLINSEWDSAKRSILSGVNNSVEISGRGITITSSDDPNKVIRMTNGVIGLSQDSMNTFKTAITADGVVAERLMGKVIAGVNLQIQNDSASYVIDGNGFTITSTDAKKRVILDVNDGMKFQVKEGTTYNNKFYYDSVSNRLVVKGEIDADEMKVKGVSVLTGDKTKIDSTFISNLTADKITTGTLTGITIVGSTFKTSNNTSNINISNDQLTSVGTWGTLSLNSGHMMLVDPTNNSYALEVMSDSIRFESSGGNITGAMLQYNIPSNRLTIDANNLKFDSSNIDFSNAYITGLNTTAKFG